jgi:hypothetical protein
MLPLRGSWDDIVMCYQQSSKLEENERGYFNFGDVCTQFGLSIVDQHAVRVTTEHRFLAWTYLRR